MKKLLFAVMLMLVPHVILAASVERTQQDAAAAITQGLSGNSLFDAISNNINTRIGLTPSGPDDWQTLADIRSGYLAAEALSPSLIPVGYINNLSGINRIFDILSAAPDSCQISSGVTLWASGLLQKSEFKWDLRSSDFNTSGASAGADISIGRNTTIGLGYSYSESDIDLKISDLGYSQTQAAIATGIAFANPVSIKTKGYFNAPFIYGRYKPSRLYFDFTLAYAMGSYKESKNITDERVTADYDVNSVGVNISAGYDLRISTSNFYVTPELALNYANTDQKSYTDSAGNSAGSSNQNIMSALIGVKLRNVFKIKSLSIIPNARLGASYAFIDDSAVRDIRFANGSSISVESVVPDRFGLNIEFGILCAITKSLDVSVIFNAQETGKYNTSLGLLTVKYKV